MVNALLLFVIFNITHLLSDESDTWKLVKSRDNIEVFVRKLDNATFKEVKIIGVVNCELSELVASIEDVPHHKNWVTRTMESRILNKIEDGHIIYYLTMDMPFPIKDREIVIEYQRQFDPESNSLVLISNEYESPYPGNDNYVRIPEYFSQYQVTDKGNGQLHIEYYMKVNPGGSVPAWVVNLVAVSGPMDTMESLFDLVESGYYKDAKVRGL